MIPAPALLALQQQIRELSRHPTAHVHDVRIIMKVLRAGLKLYGRKSLQLRKLRQQLQTLGRGMAPLREIESRIELLEWLRKEGVRVPAKLALPKVEANRNICQRIKQAGDVSLGVSDILSKKIRTTPRQTVRQQRKRMAKRVQRAARQAKRQPTLDNLHELRKRIKDYYYQLRYFTLTQSSAKLKQLHQLQRVGHQLGLVRDLTLLAQYMETVTPTPAVEEFHSELETMADRLQRNALKNI